jgi:hypothetical protein
MADRATQAAMGRSESLLFLTDEQLRRGIEAMFFAYRGFTADPDRILQEYGYGRAHHRAIHFINRSPGHDGQQPPVDPRRDQAIAEPRAADAGGGRSRRQPGRHTGQARAPPLPDRGRADLERQLSEAQRTRMRTAFRNAGPEAVAGFRAVLEQMMDADMRRHYLDGGDGGP